MVSVEAGVAEEMVTLKLKAGSRQDSRLGYFLLEKKIEEGIK